jgi:small conductance mechanosensitive channel
VVSNEAIYLTLGLGVLLPAVVGVLLTKWLGDLAKRRGSTPLVVRGLRVLITIVWVAIVLTDLSFLFGPFSFLSTLTVSAIAGIALTLALQTTLQNILAGFILLQRRFLRLGDVIQISGVKGRVVSLGLVVAVVRSEDGSLATISNANLLSGPLINHTAAERLAGEY